VALAYLWVFSPPALDGVQEPDPGKPLHENPVVHLWLLPPLAGFSQISTGFAIRALTIADKRCNQESQNKIIKELSK
jgi:hypothetical protein